MPHRLPAPSSVSQSARRIATAWLSTLCALQPAAAAPPDWSAFDKQWRTAMASGDPAAVASLTRLPFLFEGRPLDRVGFERTVPKLFDARLRRCLARARAVTEPAEPDVRVMACAPYNFYFDAQGGAWQLRAFSVDTP